MSKYRLSKRSLRRLKDVDVRLVDLVKKAIVNAPYDFGIAYLGGYRTPQQQRQLFEKGASKCDGTKRKSRHQSGEAFDIICFEDREITWDREIFIAVADHMKEVAESMDIEIEYGGDWKRFVDLPHFQLDY